MSGQGTLMIGGYSTQVVTKKYFFTGSMGTPPLLIIFKSKGDCWGELNSHRNGFLTRFLEK